MTDLPFVTESDDLRVIGFDGSAFTGGFAAVLESGISPAWTGFSIFAEAPVTAVPAPAVLSLIALALLLLGVVPHRMRAPGGQTLGPV